MKYCGSVSMVVKKVDMGQQTPPRVLIVEDNPLIAMDLEDILEGFGCQVVGPISTLKETLKRLEEEQIDVAVVDYLLEDGNSGPIAETLNERSIPFALCTGAGEGEISSLFPHTPILSKPYNPDDVSLVVNSLIASRLAGTLK